MAKDSVIILSGGMDSTTLLHLEKQRIALAVSFDYGSNHNRRELECASKQCSLLGVEHLVIPLSFIGKYFISPRLLCLFSVANTDNLTSLSALNPLVL